MVLRVSHRPPVFRATWCALVLPWLLLLGCDSEDPRIPSGPPAGAVPITCTAADGCYIACNGPVGCIAAGEGYECIDHRCQRSLVDGGGPDASGDASQDAGAEDAGEDLPAATATDADAG